MVAVLFISIFSAAEKNNDGNSIIVRIDASHQEGEISPLIFGVNHRYHSNGTGCWNAEKKCPVEQALRGAIGSSIATFRFPGGSVGTPYHWIDGIGSIENRSYSISGFTGEPITNTYGFDEHMMFVEMAGATANIVVNFGSGTAEEAAAWVAYANGNVNDERGIGIDIMGRDWKTVGYWAELREENQRRLGMESHPYDIIYWEVGNELYGNWEYSWTHNATKYALGGNEWHFNETVGKYRDWRNNAAKSDGSENQIFYVKYPPVVSGTLTINVGGETWMQIDNLSFAGENDIVYEFDEKTGRIKFGDGIHGKIPPAGEMIKATYECHHNGFIDFYEKMKYVDIGIKVGSCFASEEFIKAMGENNTYGFLVLHPYYRLQSKNIEEMYYEAISAPILLNEGIKILRNYLEIYGKENVEIGVTEYNFIPPAEYAPSFGQSITRGIYVADMLRTFIKNNISLANIHCFLNLDMNGIWGNSPILAPPPHYTRMAASYSIELLRHMAPRRISCTVEGSPSYNITYRGERYEIPYMEAMVSMDENRLTILVINRHPSQALEAEFKIEGFNATRGVVYTLDADNITSYNSPFIIEKPRKQLYIANREIMPLPFPVIIGKIGIEANPEKSYRVKIDESLFTKNTGNFVYSFPPHSVVLIELSDGNTLLPIQNYTVDFYIDGELKYIDNESPYSWQWNEFAVGRHEIKVVAYGEGQIEKDKIRAMVFSL